MKTAIKYFVILLLISAIAYYLIGHFSSYSGYSDQWKYRKASATIQESIKRGVFVKRLNFKIDDFSGKQFFFEVFIEKGYKWGRYTSDETLPLLESKYPYQLTFPYRPNQQIGVRIKKDQLIKFDSSNANWGYLLNTKLPDTITLEILGEGINSGTIKVWN